MRSAMGPDEQTKAGSNPARPGPNTSVNEAIKRYFENFENQSLLKTSALVERFIALRKREK